MADAAENSVDPDRWAIITESTTSGAGALFDPELEQMCGVGSEALFYWIIDNMRPVSYARPAFRTARMVEGRHALSLGPRRMHAWVEVEDLLGETWIVDVAAGQFGPNMPRLVIAKKRLAIGYSKGKTDTSSDEYWTDS